MKLLNEAHTNFEVLPNTCIECIVPDNWKLVAEKTSGYQTCPFNIQANSISQILFL
jgi:hypothetical protein